MVNSCHDVVAAHLFEHADWFADLHVDVPAMGVFLTEGRRIEIEEAIAIIAYHCGTWIHLQHGHA
jgi:hypothetical protein